MELKVYHFENYDEGYLLVAANSLVEAYRVVNDAGYNIMFNVKNTFATYKSYLPDCDKGLIILNRINS